MAAIFPSLFNNYGHILVVYFPLYIITSIFLLITYVRKSIKLIRHAGTRIQRNQYIRNIENAVKYINTALITFISNIIVYVIYLCILRITFFSNNSGIHVLTSIIIMNIVVSIDSFINIVFLHLQFHYLHKWYIFCCNPFRYEINNIFNNNVPNLDLTVISESSTNNTPSNSSTDTDTNVPLSGVEITKTNDTSNINNKLQEPSQTFTNNDNNQYNRIYLCRFFYFENLPRLLT
mmetsp:Transcript_109020/g.133072  ORF Transcript_109020/g.133072 Transcript_109020/m.133072 type:complete len:234 (-) Transcript_109020:64-765(-)